MLFIYSWSNKVTIYWSKSVSKPHLMRNNNHVIILYDPPHVVKNIHTLENNVVLFYCSDSVLPIRIAPKLTQQHVDLPVFSGRVKGWTQAQPWCHTIPYCLLTDHGHILYTSDLSNCQQDVDTFLFSLKSSPIQWASTPTSSFFFQDIYNSYNTIIS